MVFKSVKFYRWKSGLSLLETLLQLHMLFSAPVAQLDRVPGYGPGGWGFDSLRVCHF